MGFSEQFVTLIKGLNIVHVSLCISGDFPLEVKGRGRRTCMLCYLRGNCAYPPEKPITRELQVYAAKLCMNRTPLNLTSLGSK